MLVETRLIPPNGSLSSFDWLRHSTFLPTLSVFRLYINIYIYIYIYILGMDRLSNRGRISGHCSLFAEYLVGYRISDRISGHVCDMFFFNRMDRISNRGRVYGQGRAACCWIYIRQVPDTEFDIQSDTGYLTNYTAVYRIYGHLSSRIPDIRHIGYLARYYI